MLQTTLSPVEARAIQIRDYLGACPPAAARFISVLCQRAGRTVPYEVISAEMERLGYQYTTEAEIRNYARHARNALRGTSAKVLNSRSMGYKLTVAVDDDKRGFGIG